MISSNKPRLRILDAFWRIVRALRAQDQRRMNDKALFPEPQKTKQRMESAAFDTKESVFKAFLDWSQSLQVAGMPNRLCLAEMMVPVCGKAIGYWSWTCDPIRTTWDGPSGDFVAEVSR